MTAPSLLDELEGVVRLSEDATPGEWLVATHGQPENHWRVADCGGSKSSLPNQLVVAEIGDYCKAAEDDAAYIAALSNFLRAHHAEIAAAVRDAERYRAARNNTGDGLRLIQWTHNAPEEEQVMFPSPNLCDDYADAATRDYDNNGEEHGS